MFLLINVVLSYDVAKVRTLVVPCKKSVVDLHSLCCTALVRWRLPCPKVFTSPGLDFTSPRVVFTSPGLVFISRGVVKSSRGVVHASRECVKVNLNFVKIRRRICEGKSARCAAHFSVAP